MKIAILGTRGFPNVQGGVEKHCEGLAINLVKLGCDVIVFTRRPYVDDSIKEYKGVKLVALPAFRQKSLEAVLHTFAGVFAALRYRPDILHIQAIGPALFTPLARVLGMKVVVTSHGSNYKHLKWGRFAKLVLRLGEFLGVIFADRLIVISQGIAEDIKKKYNRNAIIIPNGVTIPKVSSSKNILDKYRLEKGRFILSVGRFVPEKGFHDLIDGFNKLQALNFQNEIPNTKHSIEGLKLVIVGDADHPDKYSLRIKKLAGKNNNVILTGILTGEKLQELYSHAGLFVLASYYEGLPIVLLEAISYGLPCIASDIVANREVGLPENRYFKTGNIEGLAEKIKQFIHKPFPEEEIRKQINMVAEKYDWNSISNKTIEVYREAIDL